MPSPLLEFGPLIWVLLVLAALLVGVAKTALPGIVTISIAIFAAVLPAKASTGALLLLLIVGDVFALVSYRREADWRQLIRLGPYTALGLALGALFLALASDTSVARLIGGVLLVLISITLWQRFRATAAGAATAPTGVIAQAGFGTLGGFTTMVANAGGPVMSLYFLSAKLPVKTFLGTAAWFFAIINILKLPVSIGLGLISVETLKLDLLLVPGVILGALLGRWITARIKQQTFEWVVIGGTALGAVYLLLK